MNLFKGIRRYLGAVRTIKELERSLESALNEGNQAVKANSDLFRDYEVAQARRISAESIAAERLEELNRVREDLKETRSLLQAVQSERLKSLDVLNVKLMTGSVPETPDLEKFRSSARQEAAQDLLKSTVSDLKARDRAIDMALLRKLHPGFSQGSGSAALGESLSNSPSMGSPVLNS